MEKNIQEIPIEDIIPNRFQPRLTFNEEGLNELSDSIKQHGIIQPLVVRKLGDKYEIIAGERRYKAATQAGLTKVPVIISDIDDNKSAEVALVENIQRRNLTAIEEAKSYKNLLDRGYLTQEQLAAKMGVSQSSIANKLRLLNLDPEVQDALLNEKISERHARALLSLNSPEEQKKWLQRIINERMTVRQLDMELKNLKNNDSEDDAGIPLVNINPNIDEIVNNAEDINAIRMPHNMETIMTPPQKEPEVPKPSSSENEPPQKMPNKFFNFLEDEQVNMDIDSPEEIFNNYVNDIPNEEPTEQNDLNTVPLNSIEIHDELDDFDTQQENIVSTPIPENNEQKDYQTEKMFDPFSTTPEENQIEFVPPKEENQLNNIVEPVSLIHEEQWVDPMDSVEKLEPDYEEKQEEEVGIDLKSVINSIRDLVDNLNKKGCAIEIEEVDLDNSYDMTIKINKN